jgi:Mg2+-importing ATPase
MSTLTELTAMLVLRTNRRFFRSRPGRLLLRSSVAIAGVSTALPYTAAAASLGLTSLPWKLLASLIALTLLYIAVNEVVKARVPPLD